jgi:hypothetical protein
MTHQSDIFKAVGGLSVSATAKYIGSVIVATGNASAADLVAITGLPRSTVYRAMTEFFANGGDSLICPTRPTSENPTCPTDGNCSEKVVPIVPPVRQATPENSHVHASITTRATKELPSEVTPNEDNITPLIAPPKPKVTRPAKPVACKPRASRLSSDWQLPNDWRQWAAIHFAHASDAMIAAEADQFRDYWISKAGSGAAKLDWEATWRNWCRNSKTLGVTPRTAPINTGRMAWDEQKAAKRAQFLALARGEATNVQ